MPRRYFFPLLALLLALALGSCRAATPPPARSPAATTQLATDTPVPVTPVPTATMEPVVPTPTPLMLPNVSGGLGTDGMPWWNDRVFYEVFIRSFQDSNGDGIGDLQGLIDRLDYLNDGDPSTNSDLGITGLWLMPVSESPSYHGYDVSDYYTIAHDYGSNDDFKRLMAEAHQRGIVVIVDLVMNHTSVRASLVPGGACRRCEVQRLLYLGAGAPLLLWPLEPDGVAPGWRRLLLWVVLRRHAGSELSQSRSHPGHVRCRTLLVTRHGRRWLPARRRQAPGGGR